MKASRRIERLRNVKEDAKVKKVVHPLPLEEIQALKNNAKRNTSSFTPRKLRTSWKKVKELAEKQVHTKAKPVEPSDAEKFQDVLYEASYMADEQNCSATRIQTAFRASCARSMLHGMLKVRAAVKVQAAFRAHRAHRDFREHKCAKKIQTVWRTVMPKRERTLALQSVITLQAWWRKVPLRNFFLRYLAATLIQTVWRRYSARSKYVAYQKTAMAATKIQTAWRCHKLRTDFMLDLFDILVVQSFTRMKISRNNFRRRLGAIRIQRIARGFIARRAYSIELENKTANANAVEIQRVFRGHRMRKKVTTYKFIIKAAVAIQSWWRRYDAQCEVWYALGCAIEIQCLARKAAARRLLTLSLTSVNVIQRAVRCYHARQVKKSHLSARLIQTAWRCYTAREDYLDWLYTNDCATTIQSAWRGFVAYTDFTFARADAITIQRYFRGYSGRTLYKSLRTARDQERALTRLRDECATRIQCFHRGTVARAKFAVLLQRALENECATAIQSKWRSHREQELFIYTLGSVLLIQGCVRGYLQRISFAQTSKHIVLVQSACRGWRARRDLRDKQCMNAVLTLSFKQQAMEHSAARVLQLWYRRSTERNAINAAATQIQSFFRMVRAMVDLSIEISIRRKEEKIRKKRRRKKRSGIAAESEPWIKYADSIGDVSPLASMLNPMYNRSRPSGHSIQNSSHSQSESTNSVGRLLGLESDSYSSSENRSTPAKRNTAEVMYPVSTRFVTSPHRRSSPNRKVKLLSRGRACKGKTTEVPMPKPKKVNPSVTSMPKENSLLSDPDKVLTKSNAAIPFTMRRPEASLDTDPSKNLTKPTRAPYMYLEDDPIPAPRKGYKYLDSSSICSQSTGVVRIGTRIVRDYDDESDMSSLSASLYDESSVEFSVPSRSASSVTKRSKASSKSTCSVYEQENVAPTRRDSIREAAMKNLCRPNRGSALLRTSGSMMPRSTIMKTPAKGASNYYQSLTGPLHPKMAPKVM